MTADDLRLTFWKATSTGEPPTWGQLTKVHREAWEAVLALKVGKKAIDHASNIDELAQLIHIDNTKWWMDLETGELLDRNYGELISLCHSELSESLEGHRKGLMDNHLPQYQMFAVELADCVIRCLDVARGNGVLDFGQILMDKLEYNRQRADHKVEARKAEGGKKY